MKSLYLFKYFILLRNNIKIKCDMEGKNTKLGQLLFDLSYYK